MAHYVSSAGMLADSLYGFTFVANSGDSYEGVTLADTGYYHPGEVFNTNYGAYVIKDELQYGEDVASVLGITEGQTWITSYYDAQTASVLATYNLAYAGTQSTVNGLGTEYDYAWNGAGWDDFGQGGAIQAGWFG
jgi:hypothetical protein